MNLFNDLVTIKDLKEQGLVGLNDEFFSLYINKLFEESKKNILIVTSSLFEANMLYTFLTTYNQNVLLFPMDDFLTTESIASSPDLKITRLETINSLLNNTKKVVITHLNGYLRYLPTKGKYLESVVNLKVGEEISRDDLVKKFVSLGYDEENPFAEDITAEVFKSIIENRTAPVVELDIEDSAESDVLPF